MEFGPRALGNRSILADPRSRDILNTLNQRLKRTEFMPFAPMVTDTSFREYFWTQNNSLQPFEYMAMTCKVNDKFQKLIPAVTHVDGTARPQIVSRSGNPLIYSILENFQVLTGIPVLVNTSLNIHEEPINYGVTDSLNGLQKSAFDTLVFKNMLISKKLESK
jgi:carbamoyltransferase